MNGFFNNPFVWGTVTFGAASIAYVLYEPSYQSKKKPNQSKK